MLICTVLLLRIGMAQETFVGVKAGGHAGSAFIEHTIFNLNLNSSWNPGFHTGLMVKHFPKSRDIFFKAGIQFSVNYVQKGWRQLFLTGEPTYSVEMNYIEIPIEAIGYFGNKNKYFITGGFYLESLLNYSKDPEPDLTNLGGQDYYTYEPDRDNTIGYGARLSAGMFREFSFGMLHLEGFFTYSFSNFIDPGDLTDRTPDLSNMYTVGASLGYLINLGKKKE